MDIQQILGQARDALTVQRVFGEPYERDGVTVIPVAAVSGGGGGGSGEQAEQGKGSGVGFGVNARPAGVYVIKGDSVTWVPAFDLNRVIMGGQIVAVLMLIVMRPLLRAKARATEAAARAAVK
jgi:uncharacterized spore protein YtfJ